jgi:hypothetical protein
MSTFLQLEYKEIEDTKLFFSKDLWGKGWKNGNNKRRSYPGKKSVRGGSQLIKYAARNSKSFYLSNDDSLKEKRFEIQGDKIYIHSDTFQNQFYESACSNVEAFLINHENIGKELREDVINNATAEEITKRFFELFQDKDSANFFLTKFSEDENFSSKLSELIKPSMQDFIKKQDAKSVTNSLTLEKKRRF